MTSTRTDDRLASVVGSLPDQGETVTVSLSTSAATTGSALTAGRVYDMVSDVDCFVCRSGAAGDDATTSDYFLPALTIVPFCLEKGGDLYVSGIVSSGTGTLYISPRVPVTETL